MRHIRSLVSISILCTCLVSLARAQYSATNPLNNWSEFHRTNMDRDNPYENVLNISNVGNLKLKWTFTTGNQIFSSPAEVNGVVFVGSWDHNMYALRASTGALLWSYTTGNIVVSSPAISNGVLYVCSPDGTVHAFGLK
jgi:outer membrane protein assembly factor BamB